MEQNDSQIDLGNGSSVKHFVLNADSIPDLDAMTDAEALAYLSQFSKVED